MEIGRKEISFEVQLEIFFVVRNKKKERHKIRERSAIEK
jgi:hypothetical protein